MNYQTLNTKKRSQSGFTLVELSIVLVIIGLIIGGVLVGQDLIKAAETRSQLRQFDEINTALNTFRLKYNALPGDYNAAQANLGAAADNAATCTTGCTGNGNGNSILEDEAGTYTAGDGEVVKFWHHLGLSGLLAGGGNGNASVITVGGTVPKAKLGNLGVAAFFSATGGGQHFYQMGKSETSATSFANFLSPTQAREIDDKIDNGLPSTGSVRARGGAVQDAQPVWSNATGTAADCVDTSAAAGVDVAGAVYNSDVGVGGICNLRIKMSF